MSRQPVCSRYVEYPYIGDDSERVKRTSVGKKRMGKEQGKCKVLMKISETSVARNEDEDRAGVVVSTLVRLTGVCRRTE